MKKVHAMLLALTVSSLTIRAQTCAYKELSKYLYFTNSVKRIKTDFADSCIIRLTVLRKPDGQTLQTIQFTSTRLFSSVFEDCSFARSYSTHFNENYAVMDNDFGDLIVADYNFDGREDFAIKHNSGGNAGPTYRFYIQNKNGTFALDRFLSNKMRFFPDKINPVKKTLTTLVHANAVRLSKMTYTLDNDKNTWKRLSHTFVPY